MGKNFTSAFVICALISSLPLACGDDEDDNGGGGKGGKGGSAGMTGGASGTGGRATGGTGGGTTGGSGGRATGGAAGRGGAGAGGMTGGTAGTDGGMGGEDNGGVGGVPDTGGMGGEAGGGGPTLTTCERYCDAGAAANCTNNRASCIATCESQIAYGDTALCTMLMTAFFECVIAAPADWVCNQNQPTYNGAGCMTEAMAANDEFCIE